MEEKHKSGQKGAGDTSSDDAHVVPGNGGMEGTFRAMPDQLIKGTLKGEMVK